MKKHASISVAATVALGIWLALPWLRSVTAHDWLDTAHSLAHQLAAWHQTHPVATLGAYGAIIFACAVIDLPSPSLVAVAGGATLGFWPALLITIPMAALAALVPFMVARRWLEPFLERRFPRPTTMIRDGIGRDGPVYLVSLRLMPMMPFSAVNLFMGLTRIRARTFFLITVVARIPMEALLCNAGTRLAELHSMDDLLSPRMAGTFLALAILPVALRYLWGRHVAKRRAQLPAMPQKDAQPVEISDQSMVS